MSQPGPASAPVPPPEPPPPFAVSLFSVMGRIGPGRYWVSIASAFLCLLLAMVFASAVMAPTGGGGGAILAVPLFFLFVWIIAAAMAQRLRDAGKPPAAALVFVILLVAWLYPAIELIEAAPFVGILGFAAILAFVGHIDAIFKMRQDLA
jgi:uncharacterized membrane protein YhaH (DUF805 family)